jgi:predicted nucleotide-binding protein (sugar kinase/HSP70/actin superfamily)
MPAIQDIQDIQEHVSPAQVLPVLQPAPRVQHYRRPEELLFTAAERDHVTILIGGLTWKHEELILAVFQSSGYRCARLPVPSRPDFEAGKQYGNNGQCNPTYFTVGCLVRYLQQLEQNGLSKQQIAEKYVFFSAGSCGPCRFGMYEAEYRYALDNAGFGGFRVLIFQQGDGIHASSGHSGLTFSLDFGLNGLNALMIGDVISDMSYRIRPFEKVPGETDRVIEQSVGSMAELLRARGAKPGDERTSAVRAAFRTAIGAPGRIALKILHHLYGREILDAIEELRAQLNQIQVDRLRVKPVVKVTGEFWAQLTEGDGNFQIFEFLEGEGAQLLIEPISTWVAYLTRLEWTVRRERNRGRRGRGTLLQQAARRLAVGKEEMLFSTAQVLWSRTFSRVAKRAGGLTPELVGQEKLAALAAPFFNELAQGGEGHMEVAKSIYYTTHNLCHMVLSLKPFGCMPSTQSDGVQARVVSKFPQMIYLPVETSGEGALHAYSRAQMALSEARVRARDEFDGIIQRRGRSAEELHTYVAAHPEMQRALYRFPRQPGIAGEAAQFAWHISDRMDGRRMRMPAA